MGLQLAWGASTGCPDPAMPRCREIAASSRTAPCPSLSYSDPQGGPLQQEGLVRLPWGWAALQRQQATGAAASSSALEHGCAAAVLS